MASPSLAARVLSGNVTAAQPRAASYPRTAVPTARELHMLNRMGCGFSVASFKQLRRAGGERAWFEQQLDHESVPESKKANAVLTWFPSLKESPATIWTTHRSGKKQAWEYARDLGNRTILRRIYSNRTVHENLVELWSNHLHVDAKHFPGFTQRAAYDEVIRRHALGRFSDLLVAATLHPAMLMFLDNYKSTRTTPNENHGRELLELHTVGTAAGYTEQMVKDSARILSGHTVQENTTWEAYFDPGRHATGPVSVLGFTHANGSADNPGLAEKYLRHLARHPATANRVARKLCVRFVADRPSDAVVAHVAAAYLASDTDIKATLRALVDHPDFWASAGGKVRTPVDDLVATCRALRVNAKAPAGLDSFAHALSWSLKSVLVYQWARPDGPPDRAGAWASTTRMLNSWRMHWNLAGGYYPKVRVGYRTPVSYLPQKAIRFDAFVDHLSRRVLGRPATPLLLKAACHACDIGAAERITRTHALMRYKMPRLLAVLLDSPAHMTR
jgi:uncharacterized protein (DUF1800 family)